MGIGLKVLITIISAILGIILILHVISTLKKQNDVVKIGRFLAEKGRFDITSYVENENYLKDISWLKHVNKGEFLNMPIKLQNYTKDCSVFIERDGKNG